MSGRQPRNVVLTGFMGCGKSSVGRLVGDALQRPFVDMDLELAERFGMSIPEVFSVRGEAAFREAESDLVRELSQQRGLVVSTGGGALVDADNRRVFEATSRLIRLVAAPDTLWQRVSRGSGRPMLDSEDRRVRFDALLAEREPHYRRIPHQVDSTNLSVSESAAAVVRLVRELEAVDERCLTVEHPSGHYPVFVTRGGLRSLAAYLRSRSISGPVAAIGDSHTGPLLGESVVSGLRDAGLSASLLAFPAGEEHKTLASVESLVTGMVRAGLGRDCTVVALGGGVVGDTAGLVASLYMRGVPLVQIPTTLLAAFDSSVGAKVAVDLPAGKNLVGAFKQPELVLIDADVMDTLPEEERRSGLAEAVKHGVIADPVLFAMLEQGTFDLVEVIERSVRVKAAVVEEDPHERGRRAVLNLGHTFGHAYETLSGYALRHGEGVAIGMMLAARLACRRGLCSGALVTRLQSCLSAIGLPTVPAPHPAEAVVAAMRADKKRMAGRLRLVLPLELGDVRVFDDVGEDELVALLATAQG